MSFCKRSLLNLFTIFIFILASLNVPYSFSNSVAQAKSDDAGIASQTEILFADNAVSHNQAGWLPHPKKTLTDLFSLYEGARKYARQAYEQLGEEAFSEQLDANKLVYQNELGAVEFTCIDETPVARIVHAETGTVYLFLDADRIEKDSPHLVQYLSRQYHHAGSTRMDGLNGRDVILVWMQDHVVKDVSHESRPSMLSRRYWKTYWQSIYKKPTLDNVLFGVACGIIQTVAGLAVSAAKIAFEPDAEFLFEPAVMNFVFGTAIGAYASTYRNWVLKGKSITGSIAKSSVVSALYAYTMVISTSDAGIASLTFMSAMGLLTHLQIAGNIFANNWSKVEWIQPAKVLAHERSDTKEYQVKLPYVSWKDSEGLKKPLWRPALKSYGFKFTRRDVNHQIFAYLPPQFLRTADLIGIGVTLPTLGMAIPLGSIALWSSIPIVKYANLKWAEKKHPKSAEELKFREQWEDFKRFPIRVPVKIYKFGRDLVSRLWNRGSSSTKYPDDISKSEYRSSLYEFNEIMVQELSRVKGKHSSECTRLLVEAG